MSRAIELANQAWRVRASAIGRKLTQSEEHKSARQVLTLLEQAAQTGEDDSDHYGRAYALSKLAQIRGYIEGNAIAIELLKEAIDCAKKASSALLEGEALRRWADYLRHDGKLSEAEPLYWEALHCLQADEATTALSIGNAYRPIAILYEELGDKTKATTYWRQSRTYYQKADIQAGIDECDAHLKKLQAS
ncbi:MAG: hypothetical protein F4W90_10035 [Gammaproteobacteria bacterium]|nr:hypothetical protein [Gammaproteobacteria bacterium]